MYSFQESREIGLIGWTVKDLFLILHRFKIISEIKGYKMKTLYRVINMCMLKLQSLRLQSLKGLKNKLVHFKTTNYTI